MSFADRRGNLSGFDAPQKPHGRTAVGRGGTRITVPRRTAVTGRLPAQRPRGIAGHGGERLLPGPVRVTRIGATHLLTGQVRLAGTGEGESAGVGVVACSVRGLGPRLVLRPGSRRALSRLRRPWLDAAIRTGADASAGLRQVRNAGCSGEAGSFREDPLRRALDDSGDPVHDRPHNTSRGLRHGSGGTNHRLYDGLYDGLDRSMAHGLVPVPRDLGHPLPHRFRRRHRLRGPHRLHTFRSRYTIRRLSALAADKSQREQPGQQQHHLQRTPPGHGARHAHSGIGQYDCCGSQDEGFLCWAGRGPKARHARRDMRDATCARSLRE